MSYIGLTTPRSNEVKFLFSTINFMVLAFIALILLSSVMASSPTGNSEQNGSVWSKMLGFFGVGSAPEASAKKANHIPLPPREDDDGEKDKRREEMDYYSEMGMFGDYGYYEHNELR